MVQTLRSVDANEECEFYIFISRFFLVRSYIHIFLILLYFLIALFIVISDYADNFCRLSNLSIISTVPRTKDDLPTSYSAHSKYQIHPHITRYICIKNAIFSTTAIET